MFTSLVVGATLAAPAAPIPKDTVPTPTGPAPWVVRVQADAAGNVNLVVYQNIPVKVTETVVVEENGKKVVKPVTREVNQVSASVRALVGPNTTFTTADGTPLTADDVNKRAKEGLTFLVSADGKPIPKGWLRAARPETVVVTYTGVEIPMAPIGQGVTGVSTPAPRLVLLAADADGKVRLACNPVANPPQMNEQVIVQGNGGVIVIRGGAQGRVILQGGAQLELNQPVANAPANGTFPPKPLESIKFDAYELDGKPVAREEALRRLKVGGMVLIAGDARLPDAEFLKLFRGDLLVLVSQELVGIPGQPGVPVRPGLRPRPVPLPAQILPAQPLPAPVAPAILPVQPPQQAPALPVKPAIQVKPGIQIKPAVIRGGAVPAPAVIPAVPAPAVLPADPVELPVKPVKE